MKVVRALMVGDVVGTPGLETLETKLPVLIKEREIDFVAVNGENAAEGFGITEADYKRIVAAGADVVTSGNHVWEKRDFWPILENEKTMLRPANYAAALPSGAVVPGSGFVRVEKNGVNWLVINLQGREFMNAVDCPFIAFDKIVKEAQAQGESAVPLILIDFHAESSREKEALAYFADGRASLIAGTHTHVQTADERILPDGSGYITDMGMTGITNSVIGMDIQICKDRFSKQVQYQMKTALPDLSGKSDEPGQLQGVIAEIDIDTGKAVAIERVTY